MNDMEYRRYNLGKRMAELVHGYGLSIRQAANQCAAPRSTAFDALCYFNDLGEYVEQGEDGPNEQGDFMNNDGKQDKKEQVFSLLGQGFSQRYTSKITGIPKSTISDWCRAAAEDTSLENSSLAWDQKHCEYTNVQQSVCNDRVLVISDLHIPYHHKDSLAFLQHLKEKYEPTRIICIGDELDKHALSYHDSDPDLPSAGDELRKGLPVIEELHSMFPKMDVLESNHGSLVWRKAKTHGIPRHYIKSYNEVLGVGDDWQWHFDLTIDLPGGSKCYFHHGMTSDVVKLSQQMGMCAVQGHFHEKFKIDYWGNPTGLYWGLQVGCLLDDSSYAFSYNNVNVKRPTLGTALIINGIPVLEPMILDENGDWIGGEGEI